MSLCAFSHAGPWASRRGFDTVVQTVSGITSRQAEVVPGKTPGPQFYPVSAIDYCTGYLMAFGAMVALERRAREGGSWLVRISLAQVGKWIVDLGEVPEARPATPPADFTPEELRALVDGDGDAVRDSYGICRPPVQLSRDAALLGASVGAAGFTQARSQRHRARSVLIRRDRPGRSDPPGLRDRQPTVPRLRGRHGRRMTDGRYRAGHSIEPLPLLRCDLARRRDELGEFGAIPFQVDALCRSGLLPRHTPGRHSVIGRIGRGTNPPPQFGQTLNSTVSTQRAQNVHS